MAQRNKNSYSLSEKMLEWLQQNHVNIESIKTGTQRIKFVFVIKMKPKIKITRNGRRKKYISDEHQKIHKDKKNQPEREEITNEYSCHIRIKIR